MRRYSLVTWAVAVLMFGLVISNNAQQIPASQDLSGPRVFDVSGGQRIRVVPIATGLVHPWSIAFLPDGRTLLVAEQAGRLRIIRDGVLDPQPVWSAPSATGTDNLHSVAIHPQFAENHLVYLSYPKRGERGVTLGVLRGRFDGATLTEVR